MIMREAKFFMWHDIRADAKWHTFAAARTHARTQITRSSIYYDSITEHQKSELTCGVSDAFLAI